MDAISASGTTTGRLSGKREQFAQGPASALDFDYIILIGRYMLFHDGHLANFQEALARGRKIIGVLGSSFKPRNPKNSFNVAERTRMIRSCFDAATNERLDLLPVRDYGDDDKWLAAVRVGVNDIIRKDGRDPETVRVAILGHSKDETSYYLKSFPEWQQIETPNFKGINATDLRKYYFSQENVEANRAKLVARVPAPVFDFLTEFEKTPAYVRVAKEYANIEDEKKRWRGTPHEVQFNTVDAVVMCNDHILMIRRAGKLGHGLWALPGGHVEPNERLLAAALRELNEETGLFDLSEGKSEVLDKATFATKWLQDKKTIDDPGRSLRGRTFTHAFYFSLWLQELPEVEGRDDALEAQWIHKDKVLGLEEETFEDHLPIIDGFTDIVPFPG